MDDSWDEHGPPYYGPPYECDLFGHEWEPFRCQECGAYVGDGCQSCGTYRTPEHLAYGSMHAPNCKSAD